MPKYLIERRLEHPMTEQELREVAKHSVAAIRAMNSEVQWVESYVTDDCIYCVYIADNEELIREHAFRTPMPADRVVQIRTVADPTLAEDG